MVLTKTQVETVFTELEQRLEITINECGLSTDKEIMNVREDMLQGMFSAFMVLADNWPEVSSWSRDIMRDRHYYMSYIELRAIEEAERNGWV